MTDFSLRDAGYGYDRSMTCIFGICEPSAHRPNQSHRAFFQSAEILMLKKSQANSLFNVCFIE